MAIVFVPCAEKNQRTKIGDLMTMKVIRLMTSVRVDSNMDLMTEESRLTTKFGLAIDNDGLMMKLNRVSVDDSQRRRNLSNLRILGLHKRLLTMHVNHAGGV